MDLASRDHRSNNEATDFSHSSKRPESTSVINHGPPGMQVPVLPAGSISYLPTKCSPMIPVLIPQHQTGGPYAVYMHPTSLRPQPTSLAVRSMTFESPVGANAKTSPATMTSNNQINQSSSYGKEQTSPVNLKRASGEKSSLGSPSKMQRTEPKVRWWYIHLCSRSWWYIYTHINMFIWRELYIFLNHSFVYNLITNL